MKNKLFVLLIILLHSVSRPALAKNAAQKVTPGPAPITTASIIKNFLSDIKTMNLGPDNQHTMCWENSEGEVFGHNINENLRIASVTKLYTSLWALERYETDHRFTTQFKISNDQIYIIQSDDPFVDKRKMFHLLSEFTKLKITNVKKLSFTANFKATLVTSDHSESVSTSPEKTQKALSTIFNPKKWSQALKDEYTQMKATEANTPEGKALVNLEKLNFSVDEVVIGDESTEAIEISKMTDFKTYELKSATVLEYLKYMNRKSHNYIAQAIFEHLAGDQNGAEAFKDFMTKDLRIENGFDIRNGSGLNMTIDDKRFDNSASCKTTLKVIHHLIEILEKNSLNATDLMTVAGVDNSSLRKRQGRWSNFIGDWAAKTGSLYHTASLAGSLNTKKGEIAFAMFDMTRSTGQARIAQDHIIRLLFNYFGGGVEYQEDYNQPAFFPAHQGLTLIED